MDAITIENANKIRASMGLAPLPMPNGASEGLSFKTVDSQDVEDIDTTSTLERREAAAGDNWRKLQDEQKAKADRQARKDAAKKQRDLEQRNKTLVGKGLGDLDDEEDELDTRAWLLQQKQRRAKIDDKVEREEAAAAAEAVRAKKVAYSAKDLAGIKVGHQADAFNDGGEQILTLKDAAIGDEEDEDELEATELLEKERLEKRLDLKRRRPVYDPNEIDESGERSLLKQYDNEDETRKKKRFTLDEKGGGAAKRPEETNPARGVRISLDLLQDNTPISDYADPSTSRIKRPKKSKNKTARRRVAEDEEDAVRAPAPIDLMAIDQDTPRGHQIDQEEDDLQIQLAQQRRQALKQRKKTSAAELARTLRDEEPMGPGADEEEPGMVLDETSEFVANLKRPQDSSDDEKERNPTRRRSAEKPPPLSDQDGDVPMDPRDTSTEVTQVPATGFDDEETLDQGIGASLALLRKRGLLKDPGDPNAAAKDRARLEFAAHNQTLIDEYDVRARLERERDRKSGRFDRLSAAERDAYQRKQNESREAYLSTLRNRHYQQHYRPDVKLTYTDEFGRSMNQKEAFKHLSHAFHGKGSGKGKTEKKLKKIEDENRAAAKSVLDAGNEGGMRNAMGQQARKNNTAGVRLQ